MASTLSQTLQRLHIGRSRTKSFDVRTDQLAAARSAESASSGLGGEAAGEPDASASSSTTITPSGSPRQSSAGADMLAHEGGVKPVTERRISWIFQRSSKQKKASSKQWPEEYQCPISKSLMADPVIIASGESYERQCIQVWFQQGNRRCFKTGAPLEHHSLTPNIALRTAIHIWCEKHKVLKPRGPTVEFATQLVEGCAQRAVVSDGGEARTPSLPGDPARPGFSSDSARPGFEIDEGSGSHEDLRASSPGNSGIYDRRGGGSYMQHSNGNIEPVEQVGPATWTSSQEHQGRLWTRRSHGSQPRVSMGSRDSSIDFDRRTSSSAEYNGSLGREPSLQSSGHTDHCSSEWPAASPLNRYVHSASANALRRDTEGPHGRGRTPLPLETTPSSYQLEDADEVPDGNGLETELINRLRQRHAEEQEEAAAEIRRLTRSTEPGIDNRLKLCTPDLLAALMPLLQSRNGEVQVNAVAAIMNLSLPNENKVKIARAGAIPALIDVLKSRSDAAQEHAAGALFSLALNDDNKMVIGVLGAIPPLIHILQAGSPGAGRDAALALYHLSFAHINRGKLIKAGAVPILLHLLQEESPDLVSRTLLILSNLAAIQEGRSVICEGHGIAVFVGLLRAKSERSSSESEASGPDVGPTSRGGDDWASVQEHAAAALLQLSHHNLRFKAQALQTGAIEALAALQANGTQRARDKATALLSILRESPNQHRQGEGEALYSRALYRRGARGGGSSGSGGRGSSQRSESAQF